MLLLAAGDAPTYRETPLDDPAVAPVRAAVDAHHGVARDGWELVAPDGTVALRGTDVADRDDDGRLRRVVGFFDPMPAPVG